MLNRPLIGIILLVVAIAISIFSLVFIETNCGELIDMLNETATVVQEKNADKTTENLTAVVEKWEKIRPVLNIIIGQGETNEIRSELNKIIFFANIGDFETTLLYIEECKTDINKIIAGNEPTISTIL